MQSLNRIHLIGTLDQDTHESQTLEADEIFYFNVNTLNDYKNKNGNWITEKQRHAVISFDKGARTLQKGCAVYIEGILKYSQSKNQNGQESQTVHILALNLLVAQSHSILKAQPLHDEQHMLWVKNQIH